MRAPLIAALIGSVAFATGGAASAGPAALHPGDSVTLADLYGFLSPLPQPGDWVSVRNTGGGVASVVTTGFGVEDVAGKPTLWIETRVDSQPVTGLGSMQSGDIAPPIVLKTYVGGDAFGPFGAQYDVIASVAGIGDRAFRLSDRTAGYPTLSTGQAPAPTFSLSDGTPFAQSAGTVISVEPKDLVAGGSTVHATHIVVAFQGNGVAEGATVPPSIVEVWQSPDVPLGTVASRARYSGIDRQTALVAFGRGGYRSEITTSLDALRAQN
ncbi:MAG TPA: hypothetical protein VKT51_10390 [Candidatus Eremiobacteraceae bacterium]|nr:hypothetical protein [Candidatus Eremiobacteraceae bacterium]